MKKSLLLVAILLVFNSLFANPVDVNHAKSLAEKFVKANFELRQNLNVELEYIVSSDSNEPCFYVFNVGEHAYVMVSADDCVRPILGYSEEGAFDKENIAPGLKFMMDAAKESLTYVVNSGIAASPKVAEEWKSLKSHGMLAKSRAKAVGPLCKTKWNQSWPYNKFCPEQSASFASNGHVVVGCAATAISQIMRYWEHPTKGTGQHSYYDANYGLQTANFGQTTYQWDLMPEMLNANSPEEQIDAVATLCYHTGVALDMQYDYNGIGSGTMSTYVRDAMKNYFGYVECEYTIKNNSTTWSNFLKNSIEMGYPVYYSGQNPDPDAGGHAFVCDGLDENGLFHFNYGWAGSGDGYFAPEAIDYTDQVMAYFGLVPQEVFNNTANAPTNLVATPEGENALVATLSWKNPTKFQNGTNLPSQFDVVVERSGEVIHVVENTSSGQTVTFVDDKVPFFSTFEYNVYAVINNAHGAIAKVKDIAFGPTCGWQLILQSTVFNGGDVVSVYNAAGDKVLSKTTTSSVSKTFDINVPLGKVSFSASPSAKADADDRLTILIKNANGETEYNETLNYNDIVSGPMIYATINTCGYTEQCDAPTNLIVRKDGTSVVLSWEASGNPDYGYNVYRDGKLIALTQETTYVDDDEVKGSRCYTVTSFCNGGDSQPSNEAYAVTTEGCDPATDLSYEMTDKNRVKLSWTAPQSEGLSGYYVMRKTETDTEWKRLKVLGSNKTEYTDNSSLENETWYYYRVVAYYQATDCMSAPAAAKDNVDEYYVKLYYQALSVAEEAENMISMYPNPTNDKVTIEAPSIKNIVVVNMVGQKVYETSMNADQAVVDFSQLEAGFYMIRVTTEDYEVVKRISVIK